VTVAPAGGAPAAPSPRARLVRGAGGTPAAIAATVVDLGCGVEPRLPRKEVIQPQLPLRLPCYDFVPVTNPTLGGCLRGEPRLAHRLQVLPAPVT
jgi:hypothetical protein